MGVRMPPASDVGAVRDTQKAALDAAIAGLKVLAAMLTLYTAASVFGKRHPPMKFSVRKVTDKGAVAMRVWRIA